MTTEDDHATRQTHMNMLRTACDGIASGCKDDMTFELYEDIIFASIAYFRRIHCNKKATP